MTAVLWRAAALALPMMLAGCATRGDLLAQDRRLRAMIGEQKRAVDQVRREVERLRAQLEEGQGGRGGRLAPEDVDRLATLERRLAALEATAGGRAGVIGETPVPPDEATGSPEEAVAAVPTTTTTLPPRPALPPPDDDEWRREVQQELATAAAIEAPEREEFVRLLDDVSRRDCTKAIQGLNSLANRSKGSPFADNALYWAARCYAARGDQNQAVSKYYDVVTRYPKGDKAPAALWAQGNLFLQMGDTPDARLALGKLIRDYPASSEAARARQKLTELEQ